MTLLLIRKNPARPLLALLLGLVLTGCGRSELQPWHTHKLSGEFTVEKTGQISDLDAYLTLEQAQFRQLDEEIYARSPRGPEYSLLRYSPDSASDPRQRSPNWNRSFQLRAENPAGGVLLLHGMSDSPYSLRALGEALNKQGYEVLGLRMPGHGTAPSGMTTIKWQDMAAAVQLGMRHLREVTQGAPLHIIGYSTGAALALDYALEADQGTEWPASLVLISPAISISPAAALARWVGFLSVLPGLQGLAWTDIEQEFDPYKYNSFATNAGEQVHLLTRSVSRRIQSRSEEPDHDPILPPTLVLKSTVDATVSTVAVVDRLLNLLSPDRNELVLFDINRYAPASALLIDDPGPLTDRLLADDSLPFSMTLVGNQSAESRAVSARYKPPLTREVSVVEPLWREWPRGVFSLSHVALPFPPDDPLYGRYPPELDGQIFLGQQALQGERGLLRISPSFLLRLRYNPFYDYLEQRVIDWLADT
jgi:alpha-beta hydrolase superfamily lysophospholipase